MRGFILPLKICKYNSKRITKNMIFTVAKTVNELYCNKKDKRIHTREIINVF